MDRRAFAGPSSRQREWALGPLARLLTAPVSQQAARVLNTAQLEADFLTGSWPKQHGLLAVLAHCLSLSAVSPELIVEKVRHDWLDLPPEAFVGRWYGRAVQGVGGAFHRLGQARAEAPGIYPKLIQILSERGRGADVIAHSADLSFGQIEALAAAPDWFRSSDVMRIPPHRVQALSLIARTLAKIAETPDYEQFRRLPKMVAGGDLANDLLDIGISLPLPLALEPLDERLRQIRSVKELHLMATKFRNCMRLHSQHCVDGISAFYVWTGSEDAVVELQRVLGRVWVIGDIRGPNNRSVSDQTRELVGQSLPRDDSEMIYDGAWPENLFL